MKQIKIGLVVLLMTASAQLFAQTNTDKIIGKWQSEEKAVLEVYLTTGNNFAAKQLSAIKQKGKQNNGKIVAKGITVAGKEYNGIVINPKDNKEYKANWTISDDGKNLKMKVKWGLLSFKETWTKF